MLNGGTKFRYMSVHENTAELFRTSGTSTVSERPKKYIQKYIFLDARTDDVFSDNKITYTTYREPALPSVDVILERCSIIDGILV